MARPLNRNALHSHTAHHIIYQFPINRSQEDVESWISQNWMKAISNVCCAWIIHHDPVTSETRSCPRVDRSGKPKLSFFYRPTVFIKIITVQISALQKAIT